MCSRYTYNKDEAKLKLRNQILVFGFVPRGDIRPTDLVARRHRFDKCVSAEDSQLRGGHELAARDRHSAPAMARQGQQVAWLTHEAGR